jgi:hypothetical protein
MLKTRKYGQMKLEFPSAMPEKRYLALRGLLLGFKRQNIVDRDRLAHYLVDESRGKRRDLRIITSGSIRVDDVEVFLSLLQDANRINLALALLDQNQYGYCVDCSQPIAIERLRGLPFVRLCDHCEAKNEAKQMVRSRPSPAERWRATLPLKIANRLVAEQQAEHDRE